MILYRSEKSQKRVKAKIRAFELRYYSALIMLLLFAILLMISGCQEESESISTPDDKVINPNSAVAQLIQRVTLNDGSSDNIVDNSNCTSLVLPVTVIANGEELIINSPDDFKQVERIFDADANDVNTVVIVFPVKVKLKDYTEQTVNNQEQFLDLTDKCDKGKKDDDIECLDFKYPLTFSVYDSRNQVPSVVTINNDRELFELIENMEGGQFLGFKFPVIVVLAGGEEVTITDNNDLKKRIQDADDSCDEDDDNDYNDDDTDDTAFTSALLGNQWEITSFFDSTDKTDAFKNFEFTFNNNGTVSATNGVSIVNGVWDSYGDNGVLEFLLDFDDEDLFGDINDDWEVDQFNTAVIRLQHVNEDSTVSKLVFKKI